jgi:hypothetical protein
MRDTLYGNGLEVLDAFGFDFAPFFSCFHLYLKKVEEK